MSKLNKDEQEVFDLLIEARNRIHTWGLKDNLDELDHGFHTVMQFIIQHMLQRENPEDWAKWFRNKE
jgi:hypothetical protein